MQHQTRAIRSYGSVHAASSLAGVQGTQLTQMLFDGLVDAMVALRGHIQHRSIQAKSVQVNKVQRIVLGLQSTLDFERGGEIARNLDELYRYNDVELFDLKSDPRETVNLAANRAGHEPLLRTMNAKLEAAIAREIGKDDGREMPQVEGIDWAIDRIDL